MRVAAIDLGTNSTRLLVADVGPDGGLEEVERRLTITRLGEGVGARRRLLPLPVARVRNCLSHYRRRLEVLGAERTLAVATSAVRDAENGKAFLGEIEWSYGFTTRLLSGTEEAALTWQGVNAGRASEDGTAVVDIGGGSTELVLGGRAGARFSASLDLGCVRNTERHLRSDPPAADELEACASAARTLLAEHIPAEIRAAIAGVVGVAGTVTTLAALDLGLERYDPERIHGHVLGRAAVEREVERLASLPLERRREVPGLEPARAPVIVAGAVILREILAELGADAIEASERDLLHGAALQAALLPVGTEGDALPGASTSC